MTSLITSKSEFSAWCDATRRDNRRVGLVPTMGALHAGHLSLIEAARHAGGHAIAVTIFVNPLQFGEEDDLQRYPKTLESDLTLCAAKNVDVCFAPSVQEMFRTPPRTRTAVAELDEVLEGSSRPGHFAGVATIVQKLFFLAGPCVSTFGRKDFQQLRIVQQLIADLDIPVELVDCPIIREADGLALSSRNRYLDPEQRARAVALSEALVLVRRQWQHGERNVSALAQTAEHRLLGAVDSIDYVAICDPGSLRSEVPHAPEPSLLAIAAHVGNTRLIDNTILGEPDTSLAPP